MKTFALFSLVAALALVSACEQSKPVRWHYHQFDASFARYERRQVMWSDYRHDKPQPAIGQCQSVSEVLNTLAWDDWEFVAVVDGQVLVRRDQNRPHDHDGFYLETVQP